MKSTAMQNTVTRSKSKELKKLRVTVIKPENVVSMKAVSWGLQEVFCSHAPVMSRVKESSTDMDFKKLRANIQEDEKQDAKLLAPVGDKKSKPENYFKQEPSKYLPYRFGQETKDHSSTHSQ